MGGALRATALVVALLLLAPSAAWAAGDPYRDQQWGLDTIRADRAWEVGRGDGAVVAVVDTGVDVRHPDLRDRILRDADGEVVGLDLVDGGTPHDGHGHGTLVAGILAATAGNGHGIAGVAPRARIMPVRVLDDAGAGQGRDVDAGIRWAVDNGADVINLSLESVKAPDGGSSRPGAPTAAVRYAWERGVVVVAAAGNNGASVSDYPEDSPVLLVGASDREDRPAGFSDHGRGDAVLAPGVGIVSTWCRTPDGAGCDGRTHTYGVAEGTSFAAPHVAGIAALLAAEGHDAAEIVTRIRTTAVDVGERAHGHGRVDAAAALRVSDGVAATSAPAREDEPQATEPVREEVRERTTPREPEPAPRPFVEPLPEPTTEWEPGPEPASEPAADADADAEDDPDPPAGPPSEDDAQPVDQPSASSAPDAPSEVDGEVLAMADDGRGGGHELALQLLATALVGASLASWSAVARRVG